MQNQRAKYPLSGSTNSRENRLFGRQGACGGLERHSQCKKTGDKHYKQLFVVMLYFYVQLAEETSTYVINEKKGTRLLIFSVSK